MQCRRCGFENMPGLTSCMRCNATLTVAAPINVHPPRAGWLRIFRPIRYRLNAFMESISTSGDWVAEKISIPIFMVGLNLILAILSVVPGLGHLLSRRLKQVRWLWPAWLLCLAGGIYLFGGQWGSVLIGVAVSLHVWIISDAGRIRESCDTLLARILIMLLLFLLVGMYGYGGLYHRLEHNYFKLISINTAVKSDGLQKGDLLLIGLNAYQTLTPRRGDVILYQAHGHAGAGQHFMPGAVNVQGGESLGKIIGEPGEKLLIQGDTLDVTSADGRQSRYLMPEDTGLPDTTVDVPADSCFCIPAGYEMQGHGVAATAEAYQTAMRQLGIARLNDIEGRASMIYHPLGRRRALPRLPLKAVDSIKP